MKQVLFLLFSFLITLPGPVFAQVPTTSQIDELKNKVASRVAQLNLVEKRGIIGNVGEVSGTKISARDLTLTNRTIDVDELTQFADLDGESIGLSDIKNGSQIGVIGLYNKESERLLARFIDEIKMPEFIVGGISRKNAQDFELTLVTNDGKEFTVSVEDVTKVYSVDTDQTLTRLGFSKISAKKNAVVIGFFDLKVKQKITATRIYIFDNLPLDPKIESIVPALDDSSKSIPSTGSGTKLTPL